VKSRRYVVVDVLTGYEHAGRPELPDAEKALGVFLNTMPLRVALAPGSWRSLIRQTYLAEAEALPYRRYPMAKVKQDLATTDLLFETVFNFTHFYSLKELKKLPEFALLDVRAAAITEFPLRTEFSQHFYTDEVQLSLHYHTRVFDPEQIERIGSHFVKVLRAMVEDVEAPHEQAVQLAEAEVAALQSISDGQQRRGDQDGTGATGGTGSRDGKDGPSSPAPVTLSETGRRVAAVWAGVLGVDAARFRPDDDFFQVGGNSLAAMRVLLELGGAVSLRQIMSASRLFELAALLEADSGADAGAESTFGSDLLIPLTETSETTRATVVCVPYAGGNALAFRPLAQALKALDATVAVHAVELPGHAPGAGVDELIDFAGTGEAVAAAVLAQTSGPVVLWGHCVGSALALDVTRRLQAADREVLHLFLAGKLLLPADEIRATLAAAAQLTFDDIRDWLMEWTGSEDLSDLGADYRVLLTRIFRHDSLVANTELLRLRTDSPQALRVPCTVVVAADDAVTRDDLPRWADWSLAVENPALETLAGGRHYFTCTRPDEVARLVLSRLPVHEPAGGAR
jgi:surfactin synthase thioesterase subunit